MGLGFLVFFYIGKNVFKDRSDIDYIYFFKSFNVGVMEMVCAGEVSSENMGFRYLSSTDLRVPDFTNKGSFFVLIVVRNPRLDPVCDFIVFVSMYFYKTVGLLSYISGVRHLHEQR